MYSNNYTEPEFKVNYHHSIFNYLRTEKVYSQGMPHLGVPYRMDCSKASISKQKIPLNRCIPEPFKNLKQMKNKEPLTRCKSMNTTPTQLGSDTALSQTKGRKVDVSNKVSTHLLLCKYILHLVVHTWEQPFLNAVGTSQSAQFRPISNCYAKHWWTKQERSYDLPPQSNVSHVNHRWTKLPSSVLQIMKPPVSIFLLLVVVSCKDTTFFEITTH